MIKVDNLTISYGNTEILRGISLEIPKGSLLTLVGPSGCGKSTFLRALSGLEVIKRGTITIDNEPVIGVRSSTALLFQDLGLFPWKTVLQNIVFILKDRGVSTSDAKDRALGALKRVNMDTFAHRYPETLSGGQKQRVGFAKAIAMNPDVLLLDEATASLDAFASETVQDVLKVLQRDTDITTIVVTHKIDEAVYLGDRVALMREGVITDVFENDTVDLENQRTTPEFFEMCNRVKRGFSQ